jgi:hypothetical protein
MLYTKSLLLHLVVMRVTILRIVLSSNCLSDGYKGVIKEIKQPYQTVFPKNTPTTVLAPNCIHLRFIWMKL